MLASGLWGWTGFAVVVCVATALAVKGLNQWGDWWHLWAALLVTSVLLSFVMGLVKTYT